MVRKLYRKLTKDQVRRGVVFSSTLSPTRDDEGLNTHEITRKQWREDEKESREREKRLKDTRFFAESHFKYNIIRS